ncbi:hypothetical protein BROUX41_006447 [Berkeleyomyces rouxiae]
MLLQPQGKELAFCALFLNVGREMGKGLLRLLVDCHLGLDADVVIVARVLEVDAKLSRKVVVLLPMVRLPRSHRLTTPVLTPTMNPGSGVYWNKHQNKDKLILLDNLILPWALTLLRWPSHIFQGASPFWPSSSVQASD